MKLKKIIMATIFIAIGMTAFTAGLKPKEGYLKLKWGTSTDDAKKAGYNLSEISAADKEFLKQKYQDGIKSKKTANGLCIPVKRTILYRRLCMTTLIFTKEAFSR